MNVNLQKQYEEEGQGEEELQQHQQEQQHRAIWGRLAIAEVPYPIIAADDVVISLYTNRLLFRVASSTFTVIVFLRDVVRIVFFAEVNGIELQVKREDGGYRSYITTFREPNAALMLYDVMLPLLPSHVEDSSLAQAVTPCIYTTDYPFSLLSSCTMKEAGFYELCPRNISPLEGRDIAKHLFFPPEHHFLLSNEPPIMAPLNTAHPSLSSSISLPLSAPSLKQEQPDLVMRENFKQPSQHVESLQRDSEDVRRNSLQIPVTEVKDLESSQDEPRLVTYDVITGELKDYEDYTHNDFTPLSGGSGTVVDNITPISYSQSHPSPGPQPQSSNDLLPTRGPSVGMRSTTSGALRIPRGSETFSSSSPAVAEAAVKRTSGGILMPESRSVSAYSHWTGVGTTSAPMRLPRQSSNASSNDHVFHILVNYGPTEQF
ncbi:uncharacterized protein TM35_000431480 [Trypanosoma theileri]|uniref:Uncharacterized protein n=1 Tax=Trypanosoma theileri TaxID=67003 RepID=A0A1X0NKF6_9TRYP|nr:uncharacterized protein TM35_000431480 [Trypanosoma theileri]ORC84580.1 hypothetical protein TM35_000431480 [Trypanosoma theileri]